jgi:aminopeptidase N
MKSFCTSVLLLFIISLSSSQQLFTLRENGEAPSRTYDVLHYKIDVTLDEVKKSVAGTTTITLVPILPQLNFIRLNCGPMEIKNIALHSKQQLSFDFDSTFLTVKLDRPYSSKDTLHLAIEYFCTPKKSLTFTGPDSAYPNRRWQIWSQGEDTLNHFWFPCYDFPNDKATSEVIATVNKKFTVLSNGKLLSTKENKKNGTKTFHWKQSKPHVLYLIMIAVGEYAVLRDKAGKLPCEYYVYPDDTLNARIASQAIPSMIKFFNEKIGFAYPWEKYAHVILQDHFGGMENTSAITLADNWAVPDARLRMDNNHESLLAHELAHQWWGDVVTCRDFRHVWLNESFATYFDPLYVEYTIGRDEFDYRMFSNQNNGINVDKSQGRKPVVSENSFGTNVYSRGSTILHMLRFLLGEQLFWKAINHYITKFQFQPVETNDFKLAIEEATGQNLYWFFDQWLYKAGYPIFDVSFSWSESSKTLSLNVTQTQTMDSLTGVFRMPVDIEITTEKNVLTYRINILQKDSTYSLPCSEQPKLVIFDKGNWLLKELNFTKSNDEWTYQATHATNPIDRIRALRSLAKLDNAEEFVSTFANRIQTDAFWAVRVEAIRSAGKIEWKNDSLKNILKHALLSASKDKKSAVRDAAVDALRIFKGDDVVATLHQALDDSSYLVMDSAIRSLAKVDSVNALSIVKKYLDYPSFTNRIHNSALRTLATLDSTQAITVAFDDARYGKPTNTRWTALGILRRYGKTREDVRQFFESLLNDKNEDIRSYAVSTLGDIGTEETLPLLDAIANDINNSAAEDAKESIKQIKEKLEEKKKEETK